MDDLDDMLAGLKARAPVPSEALMARVLSDAEALQPRPLPVPAARPAPRLGRFWAALAGPLGGFGALTGLATAAVAGLAIGLAAPTPADALTAALWGGSGDTAIDLIPGLDEVLTDDGG
jgi:hypothetical protein